MASVGLDSLSAIVPGGSLFGTVPRDKILSDIQLQGAISDFHPIKEAVKGADYDPLLVRPNEDDIYGDGNNYEVQSWGPSADACVAASVNVVIAAVPACDQSSSMVIRGWSCHAQF